MVPAGAGIGGTGHPIMDRAGGSSFGPPTIGGTPIGPGGIGERHTPRPVTSNTVDSNTIRRRGTSPFFFFTPGLRSIKKF